MLKKDMVRELIVSSEKSISELSEIMGVSRFIIHKWKSGNSNPRKENLNSLAKINDVKIEWISENEVDYKANYLNNLSPLQLSNSSYTEIIDNQTDLINRLKDDISRLKISSKKFSRSRKIVKKHDYSIKCSIKPFNVLDVYNVPDNGLLGYSKDEFINNVKLFLKCPMFDQGFMKILSQDIVSRCEHASELQLEHFDLTDYLEIIHNDSKTKSWLCYVGYYDLTMNECIYYVKVLNNSNSHYITSPQA